MNSQFLTNPETKSALAKRAIIAYCIKNETLSIAAISDYLGISIPTVTKQISELLADGFLEDKGKIGTSGGRRPNVFGLNPQAGYFIGVDIARQHFHIAVTNFKGELEHYIQDIEFVLEESDKSFEALCSLIKENVTKAGFPWTKIMGAGVSLSGRVNPEKGYSLSYFVKSEIPLKDLFQRELNIPVNIENDSRAMAYGEYMTLGNKADKNIICINISWGLGMGMILDGRLYYGKSGFGGEIGHFPILDNNIMCRCGKVGCLETGASGQALHRMIIEGLKQGRKSSLWASYKQKGDLTLQEILDAIEEEDILAIECLEQVGTFLGRALSGVVNIFNPGLVIIGGRLIVGGDYLLLPIKSAVNKYSLSKVVSDTKFTLSKLGRKSAAIGDCYLSRGKILGIL